MFWSAKACRFRNYYNTSVCAIVLFDFFPRCGEKSGQSWGYIESRKGHFTSCLNPSIFTISLLYYIWKFTLKASHSVSIGKIYSNKTKSFIKVWLHHHFHWNNLKNCQIVWFSYQTTWCLKLDTALPQTERYEAFLAQ